MPDNKYYGESPTAAANTEMFDRYADTEAIYQGFVELKKNASRSMLIPDSKLEGDERITAHKEVQHKMGAPKEVDGMDLGDAKMIESWGEEGVKKFKEIAVDAGMQPWQARKMYDAFAASETASSEVAEKSRTELEQSLKTDWGPEYEPNMKGCEELIDKYGKEDNLLEDLKTLPVGQKVKLLKMVHRMSGDFIKEGSLPGSGGITTSGAPVLIDYSKVT